MCIGEVLNLESDASTEHFTSTMFLCLGTEGCMIWNFPLMVWILHGTSHAYLQESRRSVQSVFLRLKNPLELLIRGLALSR